MVHGRQTDAQPGTLPAPLLQHGLGPPRILATAESKHDRPVTRLAGLRRRMAPAGEEHGRVIGDHGEETEAFPSEHR